MHLQQLKYVVKISEAGNISQAARLLYISQPTLSQQIASLEQELGVKLFIRQARSLCPTEAGRAFIQYAKKILNDLDALDSTMQTFTTLQKGKLTIGFLWIFGYLGFSELISGFAEEYPNIDLQVKINGSNKLLDMLYLREVDAVFIIGSQDLKYKPDITYRHIMDDSYGIIVSNENPLVQKDLLTLDDLRNEKIIMPSRDSPFRQQLSYQLQSKQMQPYVVCESSHTDVNVQLVSQNLGVAFISHKLAEKMDNGLFKCIPFEPEMKRSIYYVTLKNMADYPTVQAFNHYLEDSFIFQ